MAKTKKSVKLAREELAAAVAAGRGFAAASTTTSSTAPSTSAGSKPVVSTRATAAEAAAAPADRSSGEARKRIRSKSAVSHETKKVKVEPEPRPEPVRAPASHAAAPPRPAAAAPAAVAKSPVETFDRSEMVRHPKPAEGEYAVLWENIHHVMERYDLTEGEATAVLMTVLGPDSAGETFWAKYKSRVKKEQAEEAAQAELEAQRKHDAAVAEVREPEPKRRRYPRLDSSEVEVPDNQLGDPDLYPSDEEKAGDGDLDGESLEPGIHGDVGPDGFEEETEEDDDDEEDGLEVPATGGGDDQDSPAGGAARVEVETDEVVPEPTEPAEPVIAPVEVNETVEAAKKSLPRNWKLKDVPSPSRSHARVPQVEDPKTGQLRSLLSCSTLRLGQQELSRQASHLSKKSDKDSDLETELGPSASEVQNENPLVSLVKSLSHIQHVLENPEQRQILEVLAPDLDSALEVNGKELKEAQAGLPASSKPRTSKAAACEAPKPGASNPKHESAPKHGKHGNDPKHGKHGSDLKHGKHGSDPKQGKHGSDPNGNAPKHGKHGSDPPGNPPDDRDNVEASTSPSPGPTPSKAEMNEKALDAVDLAHGADDDINSSTHRAAHARLNRRMEKLDPAAFPQMSKLWNGTRKDKQELLKKFVQNNENLKLVETSLTVSREQSGEVTHRRELLTIAEMKSRNFSSRKIDSIITKSTPHPDPDAPDDPESVRFWVSAGGSYSETDKTSVNATASAQVDTTADGLASLVGGGPGDFGSMLSHGESSGGTCGNRPTLRALVDIAEAPGAATGAAAPKAKQKAKAKARVTSQAAKTPAEQRNAVRVQLKKEFAACANVAMELPSGHDLRVKLDDAKKKLEEIMDEMKDVLDEETTEFCEDAAERVKTIRLLRAQASAVAKELKKDIAA